MGPYFIPLSSCFIKPCCPFVENYQFCEHLRECSAFSKWVRFVNRQHFIFLDSYKMVQAVSRILFLNKPFQNAIGGSNLDNEAYVKVSRAGFHSLLNQLCLLH